jgi:gas vesicle protein
MAQIRDDSPVVVVEKSNGGMGSFLFGLLIGAGAALLFAPQSGEETREALRNRGRRLRDDAQARAEEWQERFEEGYDRAKERLEEGFESARKTLSEKRKDAREALEAGKAAVHSARDELERRLAEARAERGSGSEEDEQEA